MISRHDLSDPVSSFFLLTRPFPDEVVRRTTHVGFKILLDLVSSSARPVSFTEVPYRFRNREFGENRLDINRLVADRRRTGG